MLNKLWYVYIVEYCIVVKMDDVDMYVLLEKGCKVTLLNNKSKLLKIYIVWCYLCNLKLY